MKRGDTPSLEPFMNHNYYILKNPREKCLSEDLEHYDDIRYSWFHENGSFSVHSFNGYNLSIPEYTLVAEATVFRKHTV